MSPSTRVSTFFLKKIEGIKIEKGKRKKKEGGGCVTVVESVSKTDDRKKTHIIMRGRTSQEQHFLISTSESSVFLGIPIIF
jgi:hypothetical protein